MAWLRRSGNINEDKHKYKDVRVYDLKWGVAKFEDGTLFVLTPYTNIEKGIVKIEPGNGYIDIKFAGKNGVEEGRVKTGKYRRIVVIDENSPVMAKYWLGKKIREYFESLRKDFREGNKKFLKASLYSGTGALTLLLSLVFPPAAPVFYGTFTAMEVKAAKEALKGIEKLEGPEKILREIASYVKKHNLYVEIYSDKNN